MKEFDPKFIRQFLIISTVAELQSFAKAAKRLKQSTPTVISQVNELESKLGFAIFKRSSNGVKLTDNGSYVLEKITPFLSEADSLISEIKVLGKKTRRVLRIGAVQESMMYYLPDFIDYLAKTDPDVVLSISEVDSAKTEYLLINGIVQVVIGRFDHVFSDALAKKTLLSERPIVIVPSNHELANKSTVELEELKDEVFIFSSRDVSPSYYLNLLNLCQRHGFVPRQEIPVESINMQIAYVCSRRGCSFIPESYLNNLPSSVHPLEIAGSPPIIKLSIAWKKDSYNDLTDKIIRYFATRYT